MTQVFISWSGDISRQIAEALREWLPDVFQDVRTWMSTEIRAGAQWRSVLHNKLLTSKVGVLCLTRENFTAPWLLFEAGALAATQGEVIPYLFRLKPEDILQSPLCIFQSVGDDKAETLHLLRTINTKLATPLNDTRLSRQFETYWPTFTRTLIEIDTRDKKEAERLRECEKDITNYPYKPVIDTTFIADSFIHDVADEFNERNAILDLVGTANELRKHADPGNPEVTVIRYGLLDLNGIAYLAWRSIFREARKHSARMLAAVLMTLPVGADELNERRNRLHQDRQGLLDMLKNGD